MMMDEEKKLTITRDVEEWIRLTGKLETDITQHQELIKVGPDFDYLKGCFRQTIDEAKISEHAKSMKLWSDRANKQNLRDLSDDLKLYQALCKKIYLDKEILDVFLSMIQEKGGEEPKEKEDTKDKDQKKEEVKDFTKYDTVYGIDLGTTNSCIAIIDEFGKAIVTPNMEGTNTTPSVVSYELGTNTPFVGDVAKEAMISEPKRTVSFIKREIGNDNYESKYEVPESPVEVSAHILRKLVDDANASQNKNNKAVVITCPAYFGTKEREQTKQAGEKAGLEVLSIINEPTAAAISYGVKTTEDRTILVYDLGGGTFDVSIIQIKDKSIDVIATDGDHRLGGVDWDIILAKHIAKEIGADIDFDSTSIETEYLQTKNLLILNAEKAKKMLTSKENVTINIPYKSELKKVDISRNLFDSLTSVLLDQTIDKVNEALDVAKSKGIEKIDDVFLVGGSTRMLQVKKRVDETLNCDAKLLDPDMAVAKGAALFGYSLINPNYKGHEIKDTSANSYGIGCYNDRDEYVIRNLIISQTPVECTANFTFRTIYDDQDSVYLEVYEGTSREDEMPLIDGVLLYKDSLDLGEKFAKDTRGNIVFNRTKEGILIIKVQINNKEIVLQTQIA
jgi:molecular chaperone DnaK (HSP70)